MRTAHQYERNVSFCHKLSCFDDPGPVFVAAEDDGYIRLLRLVIFHQEAAGSGQQRESKKVTSEAKQKNQKEEG